MKNKKTLITGILITLALVVIVVLGVKFKGNVIKLKGDITYPTATGLMVECGEVKVDQTTECVISGYMSGGTKGVATSIAVSNNVELVSKTKDSQWNSTGSDLTEIAYQYAGSGSISNSQFIVATLNIKGLSEGNATITLSDIEFTNSSYQSVIPDNYVYNFTVGAAQAPASNNANLGSLTVSAGTLDPAFDPNQIRYSVEVENNVENLTIIATTEDPNATGSWNETVSLNEGTVSYTIPVTAEDQNTTKTYYLTITRKAFQASNNANLGSLTVSAGTLDPEFDPDQITYDVEVENNVENLTITATAADPNAVGVTGTGLKQLEVGKIYYPITVTAQDGSKKTYTVAITRKEAEIVEPDPNLSSDNTLSNLSVNVGTLDPAFDPNETDYLVLVPNDTTTVTISATKNDTNASVEVPTVTFTEGQTELVKNVVVTAQNGSKKYYVITFMKKQTQPEPTCDPTLSSSVYTIDNTNLKISDVSKSHSNEVILNNLTTTCGTISISNNQATISYDGEVVKTYTITKIFTPIAGTIVIRYVLIIGVLAVTLGALIYLKKKSDQISK